MDNSVMEKYTRWCELAEKDGLAEELAALKGDEHEIFERFYRDLDFGTAGLRGVIAAGTNRMNVYTVAHATQGYSDYLVENGATGVAIAYDSRIKSELFARTAAEVFAANGITAHIYKELMPTPSLSFAVRHLKLGGGVVITASHNPSQYNGYKAYGDDGCQIGPEAANAILAHINDTDIFTGVKRMDFDEGLACGRIRYIEQELIDAYIAAVSDRALGAQPIDKDVSIVYSPIHGAGLYCVTRTLKENGYTNITVVPSQEKPDGLFPSCPFPNPEFREAMEPGIALARELGSELVLATDPDADRVGIAIKEGDDYRLVTGNEMGVLLLDFISRVRIENGTMPENPVAVKSIVSSELARKVAEKYGVELRDVLTGFKFIGEQIAGLEADGEEDRFILGFEESYGYLTGGFVRDKDAVNASLLICEMFAYYKALGKTLSDVLSDIEKEFGVYLNKVESINFEGSEGMAKMAGIMAGLRESVPAELAGRKVLKYTDYKSGVAKKCCGCIENTGLPSSDVLRYDLEGDACAIVRPSGTEPKLKIYYSVCEETVEAANAFAAELSAKTRAIVLA